MTLATTLDAAPIKDLLIRLASISRVSPDAYLANLLQREALLQGVLSGEPISGFSDPQACDRLFENWADILEKRDQESAGHSRRVTQQALALSRRAGVAPTDMIHVRRGSLLHDIGKMALPDSILLKPGPLSADEQRLMQMHPLYAHMMLSHFDFLEAAMAIPYCHHEHWDGSGYPRGLQGEEIPYLARIFTIVDVFDALTSGRPYTEAWTPARARQYIAEQSVKLFDPSMTKIFLSISTADLQAPLDSANQGDSA